MAHDSAEERERRLEHVGDPVRVAELDGTGGGRNVFVGMIPAVKATAVGPGGRAHLVRQVAADGSTVVRSLHPSEVDRLFAMPGGGFSWGSNTDDRQVRQGNSAPPAMMIPALEGIVRYLAVPEIRVPREISDVIADVEVKQFRGGMALAWREYQAKVRAGDVHRAPGSVAEVAHSGKRRRRTKSHAPDAGLVFTSGWVYPMYLAEFWRTGSVDDIVPILSVSHPATAVDKGALEHLTRWYPDQEVVQALRGDGVPSKDVSHPGTSVLGTNHASSLSFFPFVDKMYRGEVEAGRMSQFGVTQSPPVWPITVSPTGAVTKKLRNGSIDPENMRPTADYSWPAPGLWMTHLVRSPNMSVDLTLDFPYIYYIGVHDLIEQVLFLAELGDGVR